MKEPLPLGGFRLRWSYLLFVTVLLVRLINLARLTTSPSLLPSRGDMHFYDDWAQQILHGQPANQGAFYGLPGYAYVLAAVYKLFGYNPFVPGLVQCVLDAGTAVLICLLTIEITRPAMTELSAEKEYTKIIAISAGLGWAFFVPAEAYSVVLMPTSWFVFVFWFIVLRLIRETEIKSVETGLLGVLLGLTATTVANILLLTPLVLVRLAFNRKSNGRAAGSVFARRGLLLFAGIAIGTAPCWIHNYFVARDPVFLSAHSGINFWIGNNPIANGYPRFPPGLHPGQAALLQDSITQAESVAGHSLKHAEVSAYWSAQSRAYIASHFGDWLKLIAVKVRNSWSAFQYDDLSVITTLREQGVIFPGCYYGLVAAFGIPGLLLAVRFSSRARWIIAAILLALAGLLSVFVTERYRLVAVPGLLICAVYGLWIFWHACASAKFNTALAYLVLLTTSTMLVSWPNRQPSLWALDAYNSGWQALEAGDLKLAENKLALAYAYVPSNSETNFALGNLRLAQQRKEDAKAFFNVTLRLDPHHKGAFNNLGIISLEDGNLVDAQRDFEHALAEMPGDAKAHYLLAKTFYAEGDLPGARREIDQALRLKPNQHEFTDLKAKLASIRSP